VNGTDYPKDIHIGLSVVYIGQMQNKLRDIYGFLISARMVFYIMPPLMVLLIAGTLAQKDMGLYQATKLFFAGPICWALLGLLTFCLTLKFLFASVWSWQKAGIILSHLGVLILLYGGGLTALNNKEGYLIIPEGGRASTVLDYHDRALVLLKDGYVATKWFHNQLKAGQVLTVPDGAFDITIKDFCLNCTITARDTVDENSFGMASKVQLSAKGLEKEDEANLSGVTFAVDGLSYILFEGYTKPLEFEGYELIYGKAQRPLPFAIELKDFKLDRYSGTAMAQSYSSDIIVHDGDVAWPVTIKMNTPLRYKGYTFFQSSFVERPDEPDSTILSVVENKGWLFPYIGTAIMAFGLLFHMFMRFSFRIKRALPVLVTALIFSFSYNGLGHNAHAASLDYQRFSVLPVMHEGRLQPLDSFARLYLKRFSGYDQIAGQSAIVWLSEMLFDPARAMQRPVFKVIHPEIRDQLALSDEDGRLVSLERLSPFLGQTAPQMNALMATDSADRSSGQQALLSLHENALAYVQILRSFSTFLPLNIDLPEQYVQLFAAQPLAAGQWSQKGIYRYIDLLPILPAIYDEIAKITTEKGLDIEAFSAEEARIITLGYTVETIGRNSQDNSLLRIIPYENEGRFDWLSPWAMINAGASDPRNTIILSEWQALIQAYHAQDSDAWQVSNFSLSKAYTQGGTVAQRRLSAEKLYNTWPLGGILIGLYSLSLLALFLFVIKSGMIKPLFTTGFMTASAGVVLHAGLMALRVYILDRPPVGTLYESMLFVALIASFTALMIERKHHNGFALLGGVMTALILMLISPYFIHEGGTSFGVLVAVLNTSFWLTTHVLCITAGYGLCILAAICAHIYLIRQALNITQGDKLFMSAFRLSIAALFFTAFGTVLGGIWADQSWGRFWGWDPKENGALLIVLWLIWALHGRQSGIMDTTRYAAAVAYLVVIVTLSWFGVNLLSVGLHAYGFISGIAYGIAGVTFVETLLILALMRRIKQIKRQKNTEKKVSHAS
tara:strand:+ start:6137 stop:9163 length:3027 start_codon:yes stop_codon:yes gene_type:complete